MKVAVNWKGKNETKEVSLDGQLVNDAFKAPTAIVRPATTKENVGKLKVATPVIKKEVKEVAVTAEEIKVIEKPVEKVEQEIKTPVVEKKEEVKPAVVEKPVKEVEKHKKAEDKKAGLKVKMMTQDGKTVESTVDHSSKEDDSKKSSLKVNNNPVSDNRHYKVNHDSNMPRKSQIQLTAITFEQLKELDFKYRSIDLEFHKMFFEAKHEKSNPSISVDFDSIPKDKLVLIAGNEAANTEEVETLKEELEKAKLDLNETEEALVNLRKVANGNNETVAKLQENNVILEKTNKELTDLLAARDAEIAELKKQLEDLQTNTEDIEVEAPAEVTEESADEYEDDFDSEDFAFIYGTWQYIDDICEANGLKKPEKFPYDSILTFSANGDPDDDIIRDQNGKVICMAWINGHPVDQLEIKPKDQIIVGQAEEQSKEE